MRLLRLCRGLDARREDGIALVVALGVLLVLTVTTVTAVTMATGSQSTTDLSGAGQTAYENAEGGINNAEAMLNYDITNNIDPSTPTIFGCGTGASGASDCTTTTPTKTTFCLTTTTCTAGTAGTAAVYGYFSGTNAGSYAGTSLAASTWLIFSTGYAKGPDGVTISRTRKATMLVSALNQGAIAAVWNHIFLTAPLVANVCQTSFTGNSISLNAPIFSIGNLCLSGNSETIVENGQPVDLQVGGKLVLANVQNNKVGASGSPITSGVVVGGCATTVTGSATPCTGAGWSSNYYVKNADTFTSQAAPAETAADIASDYTSFDPGPKHACASGASGPYPTFDNNTTQDDSAATWELAAASNYSCISTSGAGVGELVWNHATSTLTISGNVFIDGNVTISGSVFYSGVGLIEAAGTVTIGGSVCAENPCNTASTAWQGSSNNTSMLSIAALNTNAATNAITMNGNNQTWQGSLWCPTSSQMLINGNSQVLNGPMSIGTLNITGNTPNLKPLPVIKNMPTGAPIPPNTGAQIGVPDYLN